jgi:hypothetical protein
MAGSLTFKRDQAKGCLLDVIIGWDCVALSQVSFKNPRAGI